MAEDFATPKHIAVIMDGNGRWAKSKGLPRTAGHKKGAEALQLFLTEAERRNIKYVTVFAFSSENWSRPEDEVSALMKLLKQNLKQNLSKAEKNNVKYHFIGDLSPLSKDIVKMIKELEEKTALKDGLCLNIALSYGGREEIVFVARKLAEKVKAGEINPEDISEEVFSQNLYTFGQPYPDLLIRTSGEERISNFLLWQLAYTELVFIDTLWPDFRAEDFDRALLEFQKRERRFGALKG